MTLDPLDVYYADRPYPIVVREARYGGTYAGGPWTLIAGVKNPESTDAYGSDTRCGRFWSRVDRLGPELDVETVNGVETIYAASGDDPNELIEDMLDYYGDSE